MALGDALAVALMKRRDFRQEDFASLHPGGSLGKKLFVKIKDLAHYDNIPAIEERATIKEAILSMTQNKLGHTIIVDKAQKILAIISDGDLRRALMDENFSTNDLALFIATKAPFVIDDEELLASETLKVFKEKKIQLIPIVDSAQKVIATLHIHDIIKAGIK
jgi:arabinose-5-phosphate isomerase